MRRALLTALTLLLTFGALTSAHAASGADGGAEGDFFARTNAARNAAGVPSLRVAGDLVDLARRHSVDMANSNSIWHTPNLGDVVQNWVKVGENVGRGTDVAAVENAFMASEHHRENILDPAFTEGGIGVVWQDSTLYVTVLFRKPANVSTASAAPKPAAPAPPRTSTPARPAAPAPVPAPAPIAAPAPAPVIPPAPYATEDLPTVDMPYFVTPPSPPSGGAPTTHMLATQAHAPKDVERHVNLLQQLLRVLAVAAVGVNAASLYNRRPQLRQLVAIRTVSV